MDSSSSSSFAFFAPFAVVSIRITTKDAKGTTEESGPERR
jgi:hypothetical protein